MAHLRIFLETIPRSRWQVRLPFETQAGVTIWLLMRPVYLDFSLFKIRSIIQRGHNHTNMDVFDHALKSDLIQASVIMASFVYHTAMRDEGLPRKPLPKPQEAPSATSGTN